MSASLVGSEMCIRDSLYGGRAEVPWRPFLPGREERGQAAAATRAALGRTAPASAGGPCTRRGPSW
eukprot:9692465-Alexandrium_andersonii.AAC.1